MNHRSTARLLGKGSFGEAYDVGDAVMKITRSVWEFNAALALLARPQPWACSVFEAVQLDDGKYRIVREKVEPVAYEMNAGLEAGYFPGIIHHEGPYRDIASCPAEYNGEPRDYYGRKAFPIVQLEEEKLNFLSTLYPEGPERRCFRWFMETWWEVREAGFFVFDLWCNIGERNPGEFVFFDVMYPPSSDRMGNIL